ncbi:serine hydrolase domain-containing protein [Vagococcus hydrophili]|uniref:Beta-lactamase family protein n=1 Tax=Vagococcus hydrophili TaxID=2714947 RepID=A0A6G8ASP9_9ENTE|nr:serine hydrolase domain-containing protein [Vagococcus hydrophili]QIL48010.1 beta-lactamase family protein [Vagococcus hydrophili]
METSKVTLNLLRRRLRKQKRRTFVMFIIGLLLGGTIAFNVYYWYPWLKNEFNLPTIKQMPLKNNKTTTKKTATTETTTKSTTDSSEIEKKNLITPRIDEKNFSQVAPVYKNLNEQLEQTIQQYNPSGTILAIKNNQVVLLNNYGKAKEISNKPLEDTYMIASVQKFITSILIMKLIDEQKISLDTPLSSYFPDIPNSNNITIDQMLSMTSGLKLKEKSDKVKNKKESIDYAVHNVTYEEPTKWGYSDVNFFLLAAIIEKVSNKSYEDYFKEVIKEPLQLKHTGFYDEVTDHTNLIPSYNEDQNGSPVEPPVKIPEYAYINELGTGNMYISAVDFITIIQATTDGKLTSYETLQQTLQKKPTLFPYEYKAGFYDKGTYYYAHGIFRKYEPVVSFNKDASTAVIFLSNTFTENKSNVQLTKDLYQTLIQQ